MLTTHRAFLIKLDTEADPKSGHLDGRIEHVVSGEVADFDSAEALIAFMARVVARVAQGREETGGKVGRP